MSAAAQLPPESERDLHRRVADMLAVAIGPAGVANRDGVLWFSIEHRSQVASECAERARRGVVPGIPDLLILYRGRAYWIELKSRGGGRSLQQRDLHSELIDAGCAVATRRSDAEVLSALDGWYVPHRIVRGGGGA